MTEENEDLREEGIKALQDLQEDKETSEEEEKDEEERASEDTEREEEVDGGLVEELAALQEEVDEYKRNEESALALLDGKMENEEEKEAEPTPEVANEIREQKTERVTIVLS